MAVKYEKNGYMVQHPKGHKKEGYGQFTKVWGPYVNRALKGS